MFLCTDIANSALILLQSGRWLVANGGLLLEADQPTPLASLLGDPEPKPRESSRKPGVKDSSVSILRSSAKSTSAFSANFSKDSCLSRLANCNKRMKAVFVVSTFPMLAISVWHVGSSVEIRPPNKNKMAILLFRSPLQPLPVCIEFHSHSPVKYLRACSGVNSHQSRFCLCGSRPIGVIPHSLM